MTAAARWSEMSKAEQRAAWHQIELLVAKEMQAFSIDLSTSLHETYGIPFMVKISIEYEPLPVPKERIFS